MAENISFAVLIASELPQARSCALVAPGLARSANTRNTAPTNKVFMASAPRDAQLAIAYSNNTLKVNAEAHRKAGPGGSSGWHILLDRTQKSGRTGPKS